MTRDTIPSLPVVHEIGAVQLVLGLAFPPRKRRRRRRAQAATQPPTQVAA